MTPIYAIQGTALRSPLAGKQVKTKGVVTGLRSRGFFIQDAKGDGDLRSSDGIFVYSPRTKPTLGELVSVHGKVVEFQPKGAEHERPTTQLVAEETHSVHREGPSIAPLWLTAERVPADAKELAQFLNSIEGMLVGIEAGATLIAPSNAYGDYVALPKGSEVARTAQGGVIIDPDNPLRWFPGFRIKRHKDAPRVNVGARLLTAVTGPLNYRASSYQIIAQSEVRIENPAKTVLERTKLAGDSAHATVLTLNVFNLDEQVERPDRVKDRRRDIDDDVGDERYAMLAKTAAVQAGAPDIVALQEMQDNDGAELSEVARANENYELLVQQIKKQGGPQYAWADIPPEVDADGGQPGGNIRNGFLYNPARMELVAGSLRRIGEQDPAFEGSRKALVGRFRMEGSDQQIEVINLHLASKRHQHSIFSENQPGHDPKLDVRVQQAQLIREELLKLQEEGIPYYVTGDFNDFEFSATLTTLLGDESANMVQSLPPNERFDYNHRGVSQALMHGIVPKDRAEDVQYEVLHGSDLVGVRPGELGDRATDHACVVARIKLSP